MNKLSGLWHVFRDTMVRSGYMYFLQAKQDFLVDSSNNRFWETTGILALEVLCAGRVIKNFKSILSKAIPTLTQIHCCHAGLTGIYSVTVFVTCLLQGFTSVWAEAVAILFWANIWCLHQTLEVSTATSVRGCCMHTCSVDLSATLISGMPRAPS